MKRLITILLTLSVVLIGCDSMNDDEKYITRLVVGDTLDVAIDDLVIKESTESITKYYFIYWKKWNGVGRAYYITVDKKNIVKAIWSQRK